MPAAARQTDPIAHTSALAGLLAGLAVGALAGLAVLATVTTGGLAAAAVGSMVVAASFGGSLGGIAGEWLGSLVKTRRGAVVGPCSVTVMFNHLPAARVSDAVGCMDHGSMLIAQGSSSVLIDGLLAARVDDKTTCGATISGGSPDIVIGGATKDRFDIAGEIPGWARVLEFVVGLPSLISGIASVARLGVQLVRGGLQLMRASKVAVDVNKLNHIFGKSMHNLDALLKVFKGDQVKAYQAIYRATSKVVRNKDIVGIFEEAVTVAGEQITVRGAVIDGVLKIGTVFKP